MIAIDQYEKAKNYYTGEIDGYGYAFVPGSEKGVVLLDLRTKSLLDDLSIFQSEKDIRRVQLLLENGLIQLRNGSPRKLVLDRNVVKAMSTWLHIANCCNLNCPYCYIANKGKEFMSLSVANSYLDKLEHTVKEHQLKLLTIRFAGGEPTLHKNLMIYLAEQIQKRFVAKGIRTQLILLTNGTMLDSELIDLIKFHSMRVCLSLDGLGEWHDKTRFYKNGSGSFDRVSRNLNFYLENGIKPTILTTITDGNIPGIPELSRFLIDTNLSFRYGLYRDNIGDYKAYENLMLKVSDALNDCYDYYANAIRNQRTSSKQQFCEIHLDRKPHLRGCNIGYSGVAINHIGDVFLCQAKMDKSPIGNVKDKTTLLQMLWSQNTFPELCTKDVFDYDNCRQCQWSLVCAGGCPVANFGANGSVATSSPYCKLFKAVIPRLIEIKALQLIDAHSVLKGEKGGKANG
ncbi:MAG: radical SAM protein [bacterium]|nr:radical SAM protein [bacterium]